MTLELIDEAIAAGARLAPACELLGLSVRTVQRWTAAGVGEDARNGPKNDPPNKFSAAEREFVLATINSPDFRDLPPTQIVPRLADSGQYLASESTMYRILRDEQLLAHRQRSRPRQFHKPCEHVATGPNQVWSWDITYLKGAVRGRFYYLYLVLDVWSRKIMGGRVHTEESSELAAQLFLDICEREQLDPEGIVLHSDNGGPMKGSSMKATLDMLGVVSSFSRPGVSDDNPYSEALFRTLKYRPEYPYRRFASLAQAKEWFATFEAWYNHEHLHSGIRFVTPNDRHCGREEQTLKNRTRVYQQARRRNPDRWSGKVRNWTPIPVVYLNPENREETT
jgi:transposase InsO family protein